MRVEIDGELTEIDGPEAAVALINDAIALHATWRATFRDDSYAEERWLVLTKRVEELLPDEKLCNSTVNAFREKLSGIPVWKAVTAKEIWWTGHHNFRLTTVTGLIAFIFKQYDLEIMIMFSPDVMYRLKEECPP